MASAAGHVDNWRDDPISSQAEDRLGRIELAKRVARLIAETYSKDASVVHGLVGPWGSGKSSVLTLVEQQIAAADDGWAVVRFSPWATSDLNGLLAEFYGSIVEAIPRKKGRADFKRALGEVMVASAPLATVAGALVGASAAGEVVRKGGELLGREKSWAAQFSEASKELRKLDLKLLVIADDVDRLHGDDLLNFLRLVRLVGRFPGMSYLIAYDEAGLLSSIRAAGSAVDDTERAQDFLEKFVQYPIYLPPLIESQIFELLNSALGPVVASSDHRFESVAGRLSFSHAWAQLLDTPRAINRFVAQLRLVLPLHRPKEVDLVDVMLLTLLRLHAPRVFELLSRSKSVLTATYSSERPFDWNSFLDDRTAGPLIVAVQEVIERLFPATRSRGSIVADPPRVANPEYFDRYFLQGIPQDDVADGLVRLAIDQANRGDVQLLDLLLMDTASVAKQRTTFAKLQRFSSWGREGGATPLGAFKSIVNHLDSLPEETGSLLSSLRQSAQRWAGEMLMSLPDDVSTDQVEDALAAINDDETRLLLFEDIAYAGEQIAPTGVLNAAADVARSILHSAIMNAAQGDAAESLGAIERWSLLPRTIIPEEGRRALSDALRRGLSADDLAARFVYISHWRGGPGGERLEIGGLLWDAFDELLPEGLETSAPAVDYEIDREDISWASRRQYALRELVRRRA